MQKNVLKPKICEFAQKITKYAKLCNKNFCIWNIGTIWFEFVSNQNFNMHFLEKYANALVIMHKFIQP